MRDLPGKNHNGRIQLIHDGRSRQRVPGEHEAKLAKIPLGRMGTAEEVVNLTLFLLSPQASYCTGGLFTVDGGFTLGIPRYEGLLASGNLWAHLRPQPPREPLVYPVRIERWCNRFEVGRLCWLAWNRVVS